MAPKRSTLFTHEVEVNLAWEVEKRSILWDVRSPLYKRADLKPAVWEEVAKCLGPEYTGAAVSSRFKNMKDTFMSNLRKVREFKNKCSGSGTDDVFKPKWPLYEVLKFLEKTCVQATSQSNIPSTGVLLSPPSTSGDVLTPLVKDMISTTLPNVYFDYNLNRYMMIESEQPRDEEVSTDSIIITPDTEIVLEESISPPPDPSSLLRENISPPPGPSSVMSRNISPPPRPSSAPVCLPTPPSRKKNCPNDQESLFQKRGTKKMKCDPLMVEAVEVLKGVCKQPDVIDKPPDHEEIFAAYVASRLRSLDAGKKRECEDAIMQVLMKI